jgi:hypothetical protein
MDSFNGNFLDGQDILNLWLSFDSPDPYARDLHVTDGGIAELLPSATESFEATQANTPTSFGEAPTSLVVMHHGSNFPTEAYRAVNDFDDFFLASNPAENPVKYPERFSRPLSSEITHANSPISSSDASPQVRCTLHRTM